MLHEETGYDWGCEEFHPMSESLESQLIREEESDEVAEFWAVIAERIHAESSEPAAATADSEEETNLNHLF